MLLPARFDCRLRWVLLGISSAPIAGAFLYNLGLRITPAKCLFQWLLGFPAPTCGMTRSWMALVRGDWQQAVMYHLFGPVLFCLCLAVVVQVMLELAIGRQLSYSRWLWQPKWMAIALVPFFGYYGLRLYVRYTSAMLPFHLSDTAAWQLLTHGAKLL
ncbi:DUF2752 domain-containing protein [Phormidium tenue FACHB-886]|nr:DUF2752 domain-containing protein [Phormidium tenue FACHB-886]